MTTMRTIGSSHGVTIQVAAWDGVAAQAELSCACMFTHEVSSDGPQGGLKHLDDALGSRLVTMRREGSFTATRGSSLLIDHPPANISASAVLVLGLGSPDDWTPAVMGDAVAQAYLIASQRGFASVAFAPSMLDAGLDPGRTGDVPDRMMEALVNAIDAGARTDHHAQATKASVRTWVFDVGAARFDAVYQRFLDALTRATGNA
ncbi:M17 family peptidase N-terminal domain-containing protein [Dyella telluris]|uniref:Peptidase M17 n=1 Tax=Dyella telluris TaxID=2763498 RepID=A0A7G8Q3Z0_9GAMM|nr:M17 family peptidase N-terminal domain-containing protein [Dyella telluris]QNK01498.1 peptidase M17 [Dyella telluris]